MQGSATNSGNDASCALLKTESGERFRKWQDNNSRDGQCRVKLGNNPTQAKQLGACPQRSRSLGHPRSAQPGYPPDRPEKCLRDAAFGYSRLSLPGALPVTDKRQSLE